MVKIPVEVLVGFCEICLFNAVIFDPFPPLVTVGKPFCFMGTSTLLLTKPQFIMAKPHLFMGKSTCFLGFLAKHHAFLIKSPCFLGFLAERIFHGENTFGLPQVCTSDHKPISSTWTFMAAPVFQIPTSPATKVWVFFAEKG